VQIAVELAKRYEVDVLVINLMLTDHANHKMPQMEQVQEAYCQADADLGQLLDGFHPNNVMLLSDHGSSRLKGDFLLNAWLRDQGYYVEVENSPSEQAHALNWLLGQWLQKQHGWSGLPEKVLRNLVRHSLFKLPHPFQTWFWNQLEIIMPFAREHVSVSNHPDYQRTKIFPGTAYAGLLYFNMVGREANGVVPLAERQALAAEIVGKLRQIKRPDDGRPLFSNVYTAEEVYTGPAAIHAPDLILDSYDTGWNIRTSKYASLPGPIHHKYFVETVDGRDFGWHSRDGIFVFSGSAFNAGTAPCDGVLEDVPTTLLHLYDIPLPEDYDGSVLTELMTPEFRERPIRYQPGDNAEIEIVNEAFSAEEATEVLSLLRALGYVD
jgi:predicted AlkP superfamily phosphohydrolase/phosphomutase